MTESAYARGVQGRLRALGFEPVRPAAPELEWMATRTEEWGRLTVALAPPEMTELPRCEALAAALKERLAAPAGDGDGAGVGGLQVGLLVFPFRESPGRELSAALKGLRRAGPEGDDWSVIPWIVDLQVELVDQHTGFPKLRPDVAQALTEVRQVGAAELWSRGEGPRPRRRRQVPGNLGYLLVTRLILSTTVAYYVWVLGAAGWQGILSGPRLAVLLAWGANDGAHVFNDGQQWRLSTYMLLHGGLLHLGLNMWALWNIGRYVELIFGPLTMLFIYLVAGVAGGAASVALRPDFVPSVGASGALMGLMGALLYFALSARGRRVDWREVMAPILITLLYGFLVGGAIDNYAHVGGIAGGFLAALVAGPPGAQSRWRRWAMGGVGVLVLLLLAGVLPLPHLVTR